MSLLYDCCTKLSYLLSVFRIFSALSDNEPVYAQVDRHHKNRTPERSQRTHRRHMSACVQVPTTESTDGPDMPVHEQLVNDLTTAADSLNLNSAIRREFIKYNFISYDMFNVRAMNVIIFATIGSTYIIPSSVGAQKLKSDFRFCALTMRENRRIRFYYLWV